MTKIKTSKPQSAAPEIKATQKLIRTVIIKPAMKLVTMVCNGFVGLVSRGLAGRLGNEVDVPEELA